MERRKPKWHLVYFALAAFDILAVAGSLTLCHQIMSINSGSVELNALAQRVNAPGNDVLDSNNVP